MHARKFLASLSLAAVLAAALVAPAAAHEGHRSCAGFGGLTSEIARGNGGLGGLIQTLPPGAVPGVVAAEHDQYCR